MQRLAKPKLITKHVAAIADLIKRQLNQEISYDGLKSFMPSSLIVTLTNLLPVNIGRHEAPQVVNVVKHYANNDV